MQNSNKIRGTETHVDGNISMTWGVCRCFIAVFVFLQQFDHKYVFFSGWLIDIVIIGVAVTRQLFLVRGHAGIPTRPQSLLFKNKYGVEHLNRVLFETKKYGTMRAMICGACGPFFAWRRFGGLLGVLERQCLKIVFRTI